MVHKVIELVNHEAWFEVEQGRLYVKWGHYPKTDGKIDFCIIKNVEVDGKRGIIGISKDSSARGALFLEPFPSSYALLEYDKGIFTKTKDGKWLPMDSDEARALGFDVEKSYRIIGRAIMFFSDPKPLGKGLELIPSVPNAKLCQEVEVKVFEDGEPAEADITISYLDGKEELGKRSQVRVPVRNKIVVVKAVIENEGVREVSTLTLVGA
ncbi:hypothetical protein IPA_09110 [Ignicoccus pacificus DSM 13166]|uniref:Uncharacterized protein n=1 Tax=Ignicoccus pacificus DSM 13166 TaxID=940294 RepID=A0A977KC31_9CREN|nr:hypothetical protein IPA_09110 [Ignicoccus pacificus DSM 13166]